MIKNFLIAAALVIASPALVFSQDIFWSFDSTSSVTTASGDVGTSGVATIFADGPFKFDALDLNFTTSNSSVALLTGGTAFNDEFATIGGTAFDSANLTVDASGANGNLFAVNITSNGINPAVSALFNPAWEAGAGAAGAVKLAEVTYNIVGAGDATLGFSLGNQGALELPDIVLDPSFGTASLTGIGTTEPTPTVPEPSSAVLLVLGSVGLIARRKRS